MNNETLNYVSGVLYTVASKEYNKNSHAWARAVFTEEDLLQEMLVHAIEKEAAFDFTKGMKLTTYLIQMGKFRMGELKQTYVQRSKKKCRNENSLPARARTEMRSISSLGTDQEGNEDWWHPASY